LQDFANAKVVKCSKIYIQEQCQGFGSAFDIELWTNDLPIPTQKQVIPLISFPGVIYPSNPLKCIEIQFQVHFYSSLVSS